MKTRDLIKKILSGDFEKENNSSGNNNRRNSAGLDLGERKILKIEDDPHFTSQTKSTPTKRQEFIDSITIVNIGHKVDPSEKHPKTEPERKKPKTSRTEHRNINNGTVGKSTTRNYETFTGDINSGTLDIDDDDREI